MALTQEERKDLERKADEIRQQLNELKAVQTNLTDIQSGRKPIPEPADPLAEYGNPNDWPTDAFYGRMPAEVLADRIAGKPTQDLDWSAPFRGQQSDLTPIFTYNPENEGTK